MKGASASSDDAFAALADPKRRAILELLRKDEVLTAGEIAAAFPDVSRPGVSRHLRILRGAGLVTAEAVGREWHYRLNVAAMARLQRDWFARFAPLWDASLEKLRGRVERRSRRRKRSA